MLNVELQQQWKIEKLPATEILKWQNCINLQKSLKREIFNGLTVPDSWKYTD